MEEIHEGQRNVHGGKGKRRDGRVACVCVCARGGRHAQAHCVCCEYPTPFHGMEGRHMGGNSMGTEESKGEVGIRRKGMFGEGSPSLQREL